MPEHFTKNTLECTAWCKVCSRLTQHRVDSGRRGPCLEHAAPELSKQQEKRRQRQDRQRVNPRLFE